MAYPADSDWNSNATLAAYFFEGDRLKSTDGYSALEAFWAEMVALSSAFTMRDVEGTVLTAAELPPVTPTYAWDDTMLRWLAAAAGGLRAPAEFLAATIDDRNTRPERVSPGTVQLFAWVTYSNRRQDSRGNVVRGRGSPADINVPKGTILPAYGTPISRGSQLQNGLVEATIPESAQPERLPPRVSGTKGSFLIAMLFLATLALGGAFLMSTVPKRRIVRQR